jgi:hypothetical protein
MRRRLRDDDGGRHVFPFDSVHHRGGSIVVGLAGGTIEDRYTLYGVAPASSGHDRCPLT